MKVLLLLVIAVGAFATATSQAPPKPELVDEFPATLCSDDLRGRIDHFLVTISNQTDSLGHVVVTPDRLMPGRAIKYRRTIANHVRFRGFEPDRVLFSERPFGDSRIQFWVIPKGVRLGEPVSEPPRISQTTLFDASEITTNPEGQPDFGADWGNEPCDFGLSVDQFGAMLKTDNELSAYLLFSSGGRISRKKANAALKIAVNWLSKDFGIRPNRITAKYVGRRKQAEMQLWLVPKSGATPVFREGTLPW